MRVSDATMEQPFRAPPWMERALIIDPPGVARTVFEKQLVAMGLSVEARDSVDRSEPAEPPVDVIFVGHIPGSAESGAQISKAAGRWPSVPLFCLTSTPGSARVDGVSMAGHLSRPVLRRDLAASLESLTDPRPVIDIVVSDPAPPSPERTAPAPDTRRRMRVLLAEDNKTNQLVFSKMVKTLNIDLDVACNGLEAIAAFQACQPDLIFTDISMPIMDGKEATRRIRRIEKEEGLSRTPIVAITAHAMEHDAKAILATGIDYYLTKPLKKVALEEYILAAAPEDAVSPWPEDAPHDLPRGKADVLSTPSDDPPAGASTPMPECIEA
jgi:CheY-like chemotaxis protein